MKIDSTLLTLINEAIKIDRAFSQQNLSLDDKYLLHLRLERVKESLRNYIMKKEKDTRKLHIVPSIEQYIN